VDANRDAGRWGALGDGTRLAIVACLAEGPRAVGQLAAGSEAITGGVDGPQGWPLYLDRYAALVKEGS
jgi:DNA-binding transcriptional ArsR family regulator